MSNIIICQRGYVNRVKYTEGKDEKSNRLNLSVGGQLGYGENKEYVTYDVTLWGKQASSLSELLVAKTEDTPSSIVSFAGEFEKLVSNESNGKTYLSLRVKPFLGQFQIVSTPEKKSTTKKQSALKPEDEVTGNVEDEDDF